MSCSTCGAVVPFELRERHTDYHALQANMMDAIRQIAPRVGMEDMHTRGAVTVDFEEVR